MESNRIEKALNLLQEDVSRLKMAVFEGDTREDPALKERASSTTSALPTDPKDKTVRPRIKELLRQSALGTQPVNGFRGSVLFGFHVEDEPNESGGHNWVNGFLRFYPLEELLDRPAGQIGRALAALGTEQSIGIMRALFGATLEIKQIEEHTGLTGSQVYHYMKKLILLGLVDVRSRGSYAMTPKGQTVMMALMTFAAFVPTLDDGIGEG